MEHEPGTLRQVNWRRGPGEPPCDVFWQNAPKPENVGVRVPVSTEQKRRVV